MLRLSAVAPSGFGGLDRVTLAPQRSAPMPWSDDDEDLVVAPSRRTASSALRPIYTRLWPSASFGNQALWQDTLVAVD